MLTLLWLMAAVRFKCALHAHQENSLKLRNLNCAQTGQFNPQFHNYTNLVNRVLGRQNTDCLVSSIIFSPTDHRLFLNKLSQASSNVFCHALWNSLRKVRVSRTLEEICMCTHNFGAVGDKSGKKHSFLYERISQL